MNDGLRARIEGRTGSLGRTFDRICAMLDRRGYLVADETTPYKLLIEVLFTLGQSEFGKYHMMVLSGKKR